MAKAHPVSPPAPAFHAEQLPLPALASRILIISPDLDNNGCGRQAVDLALRIRAEGGTPFVAAPGGLLKLELQRQSIAYKNLPDMRASALGHMTAVLQLATWTRYHVIDFIHVLDFSLARFAYDVMMKTARHIAITFNHNVLRVNAGRHADILRSFTRIIVPSAFTRDQLIKQAGLAEDNVRTIIPGINLSIVSYARIGPEKIQDLEKNWQLPDDRPVIIIPDCPPDTTLLDTLQHHFVELKNRNIYMLFFVEAHERSVMLRMLAQRGLISHAVVIGGTQHRVAALWLAHSVFLTGFLGQDSLLALMEAQAMGRPIVAFDRSGLGELLLPDAATQCLPGDAINRLTPALLRSLNLSTEQRQAFALRARNFVEENFDRKQMLVDVITLYQEMQLLQG